MRTHRHAGVARATALLLVSASALGLARAASAQGTGLVAAYGFGEGTGATAADASGNGNDGSIGGATWAAGIYGSGLQFGGGGMVTIADSPSLDLTSGMTLEAWVYPTATAGVWKDVVFKAVDIYYLEGSSPLGGAPAAGGTFAGNPLYGTGALPANTWSHLAATYDGSSLRLYVNGAQVASRAQTGAIQTSSGNLTIGGNPAFGQYWVGRIDEVRIYDRALSLGEIQTDMNTPIAQGPPPPATGIDLSWLQPAGSAPVDEFRVYKSPALTGPGTLIYQGLPIQDALGTYSTTVQIDEVDQGIPTYVWVTAANAAGESLPSGANLYPQGCDPAVDADCDGVPDDGAPGFAPCATGQSTGCDDNCPYWPNEGQEDSGGLGSATPDGIGDACQCGDVSGDGKVTSADAVIIMRSIVVPPLATMTQPDLCDVGGSASCSSADAVIVMRALMVPPAATIQQVCDPALAP